MLVLTRKLGEKLVIDGGIVVEVLHCRGNRVKLGISAPLDVAVLRGEVAKTTDQFAGRSPKVVAEAPTSRSNRRTSMQTAE